MITYKRISVALFTCNACGAEAVVKEGIGLPTGWKSGIKDGLDVHHCETCAKCKTCVQHCPHVFTIR